MCLRPEKKKKTNKKESLGLSLLTFEEVGLHRHKKVVYGFNARNKPLTRVDVTTAFLQSG